jgi:hypothetical protein
LLDESVGAIPLFIVQIAMKFAPVPLTAEVVPEPLATWFTRLGACVTAGVAAGLAFTKLPTVSDEPKV